MKTIEIKMGVDEKSGKIATAWKTKGYTRESVKDILELIGLVENFKGLLQDKIKTLARKEL